MVGVLENDRSVSNGILLVSDFILSHRVIVYYGTLTVTLLLRKSWSTLRSAAFFTTLERKALGSFAHSWRAFLSKTQKNLTEEKGLLFKLGTENNTGKRRHQSTATVIRVYLRHHHHDDHTNERFRYDYQSTRGETRKMQIADWLHDETLRDDQWSIAKAVQVSQAHHTPHTTASRRLFLCSVTRDCARKQLSNSPQQCHWPRL